MLVFDICIYTKFRCIVKKRTGRFILKATFYLLHFIQYFTKKGSIFHFFSQRNIRKIIVSRLTFKKCW